MRYAIELNPGQWAEWFIKKLVDFLYAVSAFVLQLLPDHTPIDWPDTGPIATIFQMFGIVGRFVNLPSVIVVVVLILGFEACVLLYAAYRAALGLLPMMK